MQYFHIETYQCLQMKIDPFFPFDMVKTFFMIGQINTEVFPIYSLMRLCTGDDILTICTYLRDNKNRFDVFCRQQKMEEIAFLLHVW